MPVTNVRSGLAAMTPWSALTVILAVPLWWVVLLNATLTPDLDGGIFLSVAAALADGQALYLDVWDNKDPLFFGFMALAWTIWSPLAQFMDWIWIPLAAYGSFLITRAASSVDRALIVGLLVTPILVTSYGYVAGWSTMPGTALAILAIGLIFGGRGFIAGLVIGILLFTKLSFVAMPVAALTACLLFGEKRSLVRRATLTASATVAVGFVLLLSMGWLLGYIEMIQRNQAYASDVMSYFGYSEGMVGHLGKLLDEGAQSGYVGLAVILGVTIVLALRARDNIEIRWQVVSLLFVTAAAGLVFGLTYVWFHHLHLIVVPLVMAVALLLPVIPVRVPVAFIAILAIPAALLIAGYSLDLLRSRIHAAEPAALRASLFTEPAAPFEARLLNAVPIDSFTFARLGTNDDGGFLGLLRDGVELGCPEFHLYDFSPPEAFDRVWRCIDEVDVVLVTPNFRQFAQGVNGPQVAGILGKVEAQFQCLRVEEREVCTRTAVS